MKLAAGRNITAADTPTAPAVAIINESMARALFPNEDPIGRRIGGLDANNRGWMEIVGVIPDLSFPIRTVAPASRFVVFRPLAQETWNYVTVALRGHPAGSLAEPLRREIAAMDPDLPVQQLNTVEGLIELGANGFSMVNTILLVFAVLGLFLAALGLYGVIARLVVQRTPEIGVRVALGAQGRDVIWLILRSGLLLTALGTIVGLLGAIALSRLVSGFLPEMPIQDPLIIAGVTLLLVVVALVASWLPARRASRIDPMIALRAE
ncbi:MAG TPA: FtsX-like permease family protein [Opitutus sp.]|nr:FtsX-like permease family protein [Opitutus sp.]